MASSIKAPGTANNVDNGGGRAWADPSNALTSNDTYASAATKADENSDFLQLTNFGFAIDSGDVIDGIAVAVHRKNSNESYGWAVVDHTIQIIKGGTRSGDNNADVSTHWPETEAPATYGGSGDLWGLSLSPSDVNASTFGVAIAATMLAYGLPEVDYVTITVYHHTPAGSSYAQVII